MDLFGWPGYRHCPPLSLYKKCPCQKKCRRKRVPRYMAMNMLAMLWLAAALVCDAAAAAPSPPRTAECVPGSDSPQGDLPSMPVAAADAVACRAKCEADAACALYSFLEAGCTYGGADPEKPPCTLSGGCCYLKAEEVAGVAPKINSCACTGYVRAPPERGFKPKGKPPAKATNVLYVLVDGAHRANLYSCSRHARAVPS
jgi:hypothetical protein